MTAFLAGVSIITEEEREPIIELHVVWETPYKEQPVHLYHRSVLPKAEGAVIFDVLHLHIQHGVKAIEDKYGLVVEEPVPSEEELQMLRNQYEGKYKE